MSSEKYIGHVMPPVTVRRFVAWVVAPLFCFSIVLLYHAQHRRHTLHVVFAQSGFTPASQLQTTNGGMAQYGKALKSSTSKQTTEQVLSDWNSYAAGRCNWSVSSENVTRLAAADWEARKDGPPGITAQQLANAANKLIRNQLAKMPASQQQTLFLQMFSVSTPKGNIGLNPGYPYATASQNSDGTVTVTVQSTAFSKMKANMNSLAPGMFTTSAKFYPGEAMMVAYSVATWDMGYGDGFTTKMKRKLSDVTGLDMTNQSLYGQNGYLIRRPTTTFLNDAAISQFFTDLGF